MFIFGNRIEKLEKFLIKALTKAIKAGENIISIYEEGGAKITRLNSIVERLKYLLNELEAE